MARPEREDFPQWMFDNPWETMQSYLLDARQTAVQIKLAAYALRMEPGLAKIRLDSGASGQAQTAEQLADRLDKYADSLLDTLASLSDFRNAVEQHTILDE